MSAALSGPAPCSKVPWWGHLCLSVLLALRWPLLCAPGHPGSSETPARPRPQVHLPPLAAAHSHQGETPPRSPPGQGSGRLETFLTR